MFNLLSAESLYIGGEIVIACTRHKMHFQKYHQPLVKNEVTLNT